MAHKHVDQCWRTVLTCAIEEKHKHDSDCYAKVDSRTLYKPKVLSCWKVENHVHMAMFGCYTKLLRCRR